MTEENRKQIRANALKVYEGLMGMDYDRVMYNCHKNNLTLEQATIYLEDMLDKFDGMLDKVYEIIEKCGY